MIKDELQPHYEYEEKKINGVNVRLHHWEKHNNIPEDWYVEIGLGGQIRTEHFKIERSARIYYNNINESIIDIHKQIRKHQDSISELRLLVHNTLHNAIFNDKI